MALLKITEDNFQSYIIYSNRGVGDLRFANNRLRVISQHTNDILFVALINFLGDGEDRWVSYEIVQIYWNGGAGANKDIDGIYNYYIDNVEFDDEEQFMYKEGELWDFGLIKVVVERQGEDNIYIGYPQKSLVSNNEEGKSRVLYKPI